MRAMCLGNCGCPVSAQHLNCIYTWPLWASFENRRVYKSQRVNHSKKTI